MKVHLVVLALLYHLSEEFDNENEDVAIDFRKFSADFFQPLYFQLFLRNVREVTEPAIEVKGTQRLSHVL